MAHLLTKDVQITISHNSGTDMCSLNGVSCQYAFSVTHQLVPTATKAFQLHRASDGSSHDAGFISNGNVNAADALAFCTPSQDCYYQSIYDQTDNGCDLTNATPLLRSLFMIWNAHNNTPVFQNPYEGSSNVRGEPIACTPEDAFPLLHGQRDRLSRHRQFLSAQRRQDPALCVDYRDWFDPD